MPTAATIQGGAPLTEGYSTLSLATLIPEALTGIRLYLKDESRAKIHLFRSEETPFHNADRKRLSENGVRQVYIRLSDRPRYREYLVAHLEEILASDRFTSRQRFGTLSEVAQSTLHRLFRKLDLDETLLQLRELAHHCVTQFSRDDYRAADLLSVLTHQHHMATHSANVALLCLLLARAADIHSPRMLAEIAVGAFLHDIGKLVISSDVLLKTTPFSKEELEQLHDHPRQGFLKLCHRKDLSRGQLMMVYQHHEHIDGTGNPVGCTASEIHEWAQICAVADLFETLSANRPYALSFRLPDVLQIMEREAGSYFSWDLFLCWKNIINPPSDNF